MSRTVFHRCQVTTMLRIALASPPVSGSVHAAMPWVERFIAEAADGEADIVCFPECYIPGLRGQDFSVEALIRPA